MEERYNGRGITASGEFAMSHYFDRLMEIGDFQVATDRNGGYPYPYLDFGITDMNGRLFYVIGYYIFFVEK